MYYFIPQHSWGLTNNDEENVTGFFSHPGGPCRPVSLYCEQTNRGAFAHWDDDSMMTEELLDWLIDDGNNPIQIYTTEDTMEEVVARIRELNAEIDVIQHQIGVGIWGFTFKGNLAPIDVDHIPEENRVDMPVNWSQYWENGAPDWQNSVTFTSGVILNLNGFFANYNGQYYFDFE